MKKSTKTPQPEANENLIFETIEKIADAFAKTFPRNMEIVVHDFANLQRSIRFIAGNVTNRSIGGPATDFVIRSLHAEGSKIADRFNYKTNTSDGRELKSSTVFIRNAKDEVIGAFCINFDMTDYQNAQLAIDTFAKAGEDYREDLKLETFSASFPETIEAMFKEAVAKIGKHNTAMSKKERLQLIKELELNGVFRLKGAVDEVALLMGVSKFTVYNYINENKTEGGFNLI